MTYPFVNGDVLSAADLNAYAGLVLVKTQTIGTAVSSVTVTDAFSSTFDNYRVIVADGACSTNANMSVQLSGVTTGYYGASIGASYTAGTPNGLGDNNVAQWSYAGWAGTAHLNLVCDLLSPNLATRTSITTGWTYYFGQSSYSVYIGETVSTTAATGFVITPSAGTLTGGTIRVYGYNNG